MSPNLIASETARPEGAPAAEVDPGPLLRAVEAKIELRDGTRVLDAASLELGRGELVVLVGPSGSGKTTLLEALAGVRTTTSGRVDVRNDALPLGYVPQDDIVHRDLSVVSTVRHAARLRLPSGTSSDDIEATVERTLRRLGLWHRRELLVGALSGGQRKRASIATELVVQPTMCLLDEPTAGLDPLARAALMDVLRNLADSGTAIVMTSHHLADLEVADRLMVMADGGRIVFDGSPADAAAPIRRSSDERAEAPTRRVAERVEERVDTPMAVRGEVSARRQSTVLAARNVELLRRNRMSLAIMAGSPVLIVAMFVTLFPAGAFDTAVGDGSTAVAIVYWLAFAGFFFGLTFGLLQICTELPIVRRERLVPIGLGQYLLAKVVVLVPLLGAANLVMIATLQLFDRLPALDARGVVGLWLLLGLDALAGLALGLLASASVHTTAQAALALPMLCFPAVLFSGAVLPVRSMTVAGRAIAAVVSDRWAFEALARTLHVDGLGGGVPTARAVELHGGALTGPTIAHAAVLVVFTGALLIGARLVLERRTRPGAGGRARRPH